MNVDILIIKHYQNETEYSTMYTIRDKDGKFPICKEGAVYYGDVSCRINQLLAVMEKPHQEGNLELCVYEIDGKFAVYDENHNRVTPEHDFMDDLIEEIEEMELKIFDFEFER